MPIVRIDIQSGKSTQYRRAVLQGVRAAITTAFDLADERIMQRLIETQAEDIDIMENRSKALTIIELSMLPGRGADLKSKLYESIVANLSANPGIHAADIMVIVSEPSAECFVLGGVMQCTLSPVQTPGEDDEE